MTQNSALSEQGWLFNLDHFLYQNTLYFLVPETNTFSQFTTNQKSEMTKIYILSILIFK